MKCAKLKKKYYKARNFQKIGKEAYQYQLSILLASIMKLFTYLLKLQIGKYIEISGE